MMEIAGLTGEQNRFANHDGGAFVHACPGAGKTRTLIVRLAKISEILEPRRGIAVLSFTNSAADEFRDRCRMASLDSLLKYPSYAGTLDTFVQRFIVLPGCTASSSVRPVFLDSWDRLGVQIRLAGQYTFRGDGVSLDAFNAETNIIDPDLIGNRALQNHVRQNQNRYQQAAATSRRNLINAGYISAADCRIEALKLIRNPLRRQTLGRALGARFHEIMVDEGQDCNPHDFEILSWLRQHGTQITFVCDPDQAIYGFRQGNVRGLDSFRETYQPDCRQALSGNFRSSSTICLFAATLRNAGNADQALGVCASIRHPVVVLVYQSRAPDGSIGRAFEAHLSGLGLPPSSSIILAHQGRIAQRAAGEVSLEGSNSTSRIGVMVRAVAEFWSSASTSRSRESALYSVESLLFDLMGLRESGEHALRTMSRTGTNRRLHRRRALTLVTNIPRFCADTDDGRNEWVECLRSKVEQLNLELKVAQTVRRFFPQPANGSWASGLQASETGGLNWSTIHEAKGHEFDAVCVVIPPNQTPRNRTDILLNAWENRLDEESKRVIFVGVTRARKLCVLAIPIAISDRCIALLTAGNVPHLRQSIQN